MPISTATAAPSPGDDLEQRIREWIAAQEQTPNPDSFIAISDKHIRGPFSTGEDAQEAAFRQEPRGNHRIIRISDLGKGPSEERIRRAGYYKEALTR